MSAFNHDHMSDFELAEWERQIKRDKKMSKKVQRWYVTSKGVLIHCDDHEKIEEELKEQICKSSDVAELEDQCVWAKEQYFKLLQYVHKLETYETGATYEEIQAAAGCDILVEGIPAEGKR